MFNSQKLFQLFAVVSLVGGVGRFDSIGGVYDENTALNLSKQMYYQVRARSLVSNLASTKGGINQVGAFEAPDLQGVIERKEIASGDMVRFTMEENIKGMVTYGDKPVVAGDFIAYKNKEGRLNRIDTPAIQVPGDMSQQRVKGSIDNIPASVKRQVVEFLAEEKEFQAIPACLQGASPNLLSSTGDGGLGMSLGSGDGAGAGVPLMNKWFYTANSGFCTYSSTPATYNDTVDTAIEAIDASADDAIKLASLDIIRAKMDEIYFEPIDILGQRLKAVCGLDPDAMWRLKGLLGDWYKYAMPRGQGNPFWNTKGAIIYNEIAYFAWPNLKKYRPTAVNAGATDCPTFGPVSAGVDPRTYTTSSTNALALFMGGKALMEGYIGQVGIEENWAPFHKACAYSGNEKYGYVRGEWYSKDGRAASVDNTENRSLIIASFYEPGVGVTVS